MNSAVGRNSQMLVPIGHGLCAKLEKGSTQKQSEGLVQKAVWRLLGLGDAHKNFSRIVDVVSFKIQRNDMFPTFVGVSLPIDVLQEFCIGGNINLCGKNVSRKPYRLVVVALHRVNLAVRVGRLTGAGIFYETQKWFHHVRLLNTQATTSTDHQELLPLEQLVSSWVESNVVGCDSAQCVLVPTCSDETATEKHKLFWLWGDTNLARFPLGLYNCSGAWSGLPACESACQVLRLPFALRFDMFCVKKELKSGFALLPRNIANFATEMDPNGQGPTWIFSLVAFSQNLQGQPLLGGCYRKIKSGTLEHVEIGLCVWKKDAECFESLHRLEDGALPDDVLQGQASLWTDPLTKQEWFIFGNPFPVRRCPATFEHWSNVASWQDCGSRPTFLIDARQQEYKVIPHGGHGGWHPARRKWVVIFTEQASSSASPSFLGEIWYTEADTPYGPWQQKTAIKVISHCNYTFYNPRLHLEWSIIQRRVEESHQRDVLSPTGHSLSSSMSLYVEGTYTTLFTLPGPGSLSLDLAQRPTPRYDYNQILYQLNLEDIPISVFENQATFYMLKKPKLND